MDESPNEDQLAIAEYFNSDFFRNSKRDPVAVRALDDYPLFIVSVVLCGLLSGCGIWAVAMLKMIERTTSVPSFTKAILLTDAMVYPISTMFTIAVTVALFWRGSLWRRTLVSLSIIAPAMLIFFGLARQSFDFVEKEFVLNLTAWFFGLFVGAGATTVLFRMFSPYTLLEHACIDQVKLSPTNLFAFFELTIFFAIIFVAVSIFSEDSLLLVTVGCAAWSCSVATSVIALFIAFLNDKKVSKTALVVAIIGCTLPSFFWTGASAMGGFGWSINLVNFVSIALLALIGLAIQIGFFALCIRVLHSHGCVCVNRRKPRHVS